MSAEFSAGRPIVVLYAEDRDDDVELTRLGFERSRFAVNLQRVEDGEECMAFLRKQGKYASAPSPDLLLLDINMPRMNGFEVLREIAGDDVLRRLPVVVLTTSRADEDRVKMYELRCSSFIKKPVDFQKFVEVVQKLTDYWFTVVSLPEPKDRPPSS